MAWQHVGESFMKEIDFGRVWLRLNEADEGERDVIFGQWSGEAKSFLSQTLVRSFLRCDVFQLTAHENRILIYRVPRPSLN